MSSFVVRIDDLDALLSSWTEMLKGGSGDQAFQVNWEVVGSLGDWTRIKWFYYCDDQNGNTIRLYDAEHLEQLGQPGPPGYRHYLEKDGTGKEHFERVIIRGEMMWSGDEAVLTRQESLRVRFRNNPLWRIYSARQAPIRSKMVPPAGMKSRARNPQLVDIQSGTRRDWRLWYFEGLNQLPTFAPPDIGQQEPAAGGLADLLGRLRLPGTSPNAEPGVEPDRRIAIRSRFTLEYWRDGAFLVGRLLEVPGVFSQGETLEELQENIQDAYDLVVTQQRAPAPALAQRQPVELEV